MAVDSQVNCRDIDADRSWVAANILELSEPDCGPAPGPPTDLVAASALTPFEYRITVKWIDPAHGKIIIGVVVVACSCRASLQENVDHGSDFTIMLRLGIVVLDEVLK